MSLVFDPAVHVDATILTGVTLNRRRAVQDIQLVAVLDHDEILMRHNSDLRKQSALRLPALGTTAEVVVGALTLNSDFDRRLRAFAHKGSSGKVRLARFHAVIYGGMNRN